MKTNQTPRKTGFTLVEIMIVVAIIGLLAVIAVPNVLKARKTSQANACINNLRQLSSAQQQWALTNNKVDGDTVTLNDLSPYIKLQNNGTTLPSCPASGTYIVSNVGTQPECNIGNTVTPGHALP